MKWFSSAGRVSLLGKTHRTTSRNCLPLEWCGRPGLASARTDSVGEMLLKAIENLRVHLQGLDTSRHSQSRGHVCSQVIRSTYRSTLCDGVPALDAAFKQGGEGPTGKSGTNRLKLVGTTAYATTCKPDKQVTKILGPRVLQKFLGDRMLLNSCFFC